MSSIAETQYPIFRFWEAPSFDPIVSWTILVDRGETTHFHPRLRRVIGSKLTSFTSHNVFKDMHEDISLPNAQVEDYYLKVHEFEALKLYRTFTFQVMSMDIIGLDGTIYGMQTCSVMPIFVVEWWDGGPDGWREMTDWAAQTRVYLSNLIDRPDLDLDFKDINQIHPPDYKIWRPVDKG